MLGTRFGFTAVAFFAALCFSAGLLGVPAASSDQAFDGHRTVGVRKCATCHKKKTLGNQLAAWRAAACGGTLQAGLGTERRQTCAFGP